MEGLEEALETSVRVSMDDSDTVLIHPRYAQYKAKTSKSNQAERRAQCLEKQKQQRLATLNEHRCISSCTVEEVLNPQLPMEEAEAEPQKQVTKAQYKNAIMMSEWLVDVPEDLNEKWVVKICPEGKRVLVVAEKGWTVAYGRNGRTVVKFPSALPSGSNRTKSSAALTMLDAVYSFVTKTFYVLDVLVWARSVILCSADFRFFWLSSKLSDTPELSTRSKRNPYVFKEVTRHAVGELDEALGAHPAFPANRPRVDGVLFYHEDGLYEAGIKSPLVTWLKPFMLPEILGVPVHRLYHEEKPPQYLKQSKMEVTEEVVEGVKTTNEEPMN